jgi:hypothetical protein
MPNITANFLVSADLTKSISIMDFWYRLVNPPLMVSAIVTSRYQ